MVGIMSHRRSLRFSKTTCPICGSKEVARDDNKGDLLCTNCGHIIVRTETRTVGKYDIAQHIKRNGKMTFPMLQSATSASDDKLFGVIRNIDNLFCKKPWINRVADVSAARNTVIQLEVAIVVPGQCRDTVKWIQAKPCQCVGKPANSAKSVCVSVAVPWIVVDYRDNLSFRMLRLRMPHD